MKIFLISPVRRNNPQVEQEVRQYVEAQEAVGNEVYWPLRDTDQDDPVGYNICRLNVNAIEAADEVHVWFDPGSQGSLFDLGAAFALGKIIRLVNRVFKTEGKSFSNLLLLLDMGNKLRDREEAAADD